MPATLFTSATATYVTADFPANIEVTQLFIGNTQTSSAIPVSIKPLLSEETEQQFWNRVAAYIENAMLVLGAVTVEPLTLTVENVALNSVITAKKFTLDKVFFRNVRMDFTEISGTNNIAWFYTEFNIPDEQNSYNNEISRTQKDMS